MESSHKNTYVRYFTTLIYVFGMVGNLLAEKYYNPKKDFNWIPGDSDRTPIRLHFPIRDQKSYEYKLSRNPFNLADPPSIRRKAYLDSTSDEYFYQVKIGKLDYRNPPSVPMKSRLKQDASQLNTDYFKQRAQANNFVRGNSVIPPLVMQSKVFDRIFGSGVIDIRPRGTAELIFAGNFNEVRNPAFSLRQQNTGQFDFRQKIQLNVAGSVGDKLKVNMNYDTEATFEFENQMKLNYAGKEDDILKKVELGNVSLPMSSSLIQGSQSLFGIKTAMQFGKLSVTTVLSQQRGKTTETEIQGGAQTTKFDIQCDNYDMNRHYFLSQYFYENYDRALSRLPIISSSVIITRVEVWITNRSGSFDQSRAVIGFTDLGENHRVINPYWQRNATMALGNESNGLWGYVNGYGNTFQLNGSTNNKVKNELRSLYGVENQLQQDYLSTQIEPISEYQIINYARQLGPTEFTFNRNLGFISLNQALSNDDILCVAFEGTVGGIPFKVGEFGQDVPVDPSSPNVLHLKMLKGPSMRPDLVSWRLMMKNVYALNSFNLTRNDFKFNLIYADDPSGADLNYIPIQNEPLLTGKPLLSVLNLDNVNSQLEAAPDGVFDFIEGVTVNTTTGRIFLPMVEPFGRYLRKKFINDTIKADYYCFPELYDSTRFAASQLTQYNKFFLRGSYSGANNSEIPLNSTNVPKGSVKVTANGAPLTEGVDYIVDYNLGKVKIVNTQLLNSSAIIRVSSESNNMFQVQQKSLIGTRLEYQHNLNTMLGGTLLYLTERPLTPKVNIGEEPVANLMIGLDGSIKRESRFITKMIDKLPFIETKEPSMVSFNGEYAELIPGVQSALAQNGTAYLDDFEAAEVPFDLRMGNNWVLASTPHGQADIFPEGNQVSQLENGYKRANLSWYSIASTFYNSNDPYTPAHIKSDPNAISNHRMRQIFQNEIFKGRQIQQGMPQTLPTFDLTFYPKERGPYNYNVNDLNADGSLRYPKLNWGGIMRKIDQNDFEQANIDYIEIWMMDPFADNPSSTNKGSLYINLGNISEDVLRDNRRIAENGLPKDASPAQQSNMDTTVWGRVPRQPVITYSFDADNNIRKFQDIGLDGFDDDGEREHFKTSYLDKIANNPSLGVNSDAYKNALADPSNDNYHYYLGSDLDNKTSDVISRYRRYNMTQGNSPTVDQSPESYPTAATNMPDNEDLNKDFTLNTVEEYFQYKIDVSKEGLQIGKNYVVDTVSVRNTAQFSNGSSAVPEIWYQLKIPVHEFQSKVGAINDFKSIRFIRMFVRGFEDSVTLRFASMQLVRADWRKYLNNLRIGGEDQPLDPTDNTQFVVSTVNVEKNGDHKPPYIVPPGIKREVDFSSPTPIYQNEQALSVKVCNLADGDARAVFKNTTVDFRRYGKLRMFVHADGNTIKNNELTAFIRFGTDLINNYYEYEIPLKITPQNATSDREVWPSENEITITLEELINTKIMRTNANWPFSRPYIRQDGDIRYTVVGLPDFSQVKVVMLGVRNPKRLPGSIIDDGLPKCAEVWFNELRMTDFNQRGGRAANGRLIMKLADFGNLQLSGSYSSVGWGGIDKKITERSLNDNYQYDLQSTFELGKVFPKTSGISIPFFFSYGNTLIRPYYNPLNPDTRLQKEIDQTINPERKDIISHASDDYTARRSINFTNVRKTRVGTKRVYPWDIENFSITYIFNETFKRNQTLAYSILQTYRGVLSYTYNFSAKPIEPFAKVIKSKYLTLIKDINFNYMPSTIGFRTEVDRRYGELLNRNNDNPNTIIPTLFDKNFTMRRYYELRYDITKSLKFDYTGTADTRVDEPIGKIDESTPEKRDTIQKNFWSGGRMTKFDQSVHLNYTIPINKIPFLDFINQCSYNYTANYQWNQAPPIAQSLGNTIQNSRQQQVNLGMNLSMFYNRFKIIRSLNAPATQNKNSEEGPKRNAKPVKGKKNDENTGPGSVPLPVKAILKLITGIKSVSGSYSLNEGTMLPGFRLRPQYLGQNSQFNAPGYDFILGSQSADFRYNAAKNGWMSTDSSITNPYTQTYNETVNGSLTYEPFEDFRVSLTLTKTYNRSMNSFFRYDKDSGIFKDFGPVMEQGSYSISYYTLPTSFSAVGADNITEAFHQFERNRIVIANRIAEEKGISNRDSSFFPVGYGAYSQDVIIPAFLAAYTGKDAAKVDLTAFPAIPLPNWKITYNGMSKLKGIKEYASNISISHGYQSTYSVGNFQTVIDTSRNLVASTDFKPHYVIRNFSITERFGPLIGIDVTLKKNITAGIKYNKDRMLNFAMGNRQLSEQKAEEIVINVGYRTNKLVLPFRINGRRAILENDVNFRFDFSIRDNVTHIAYLDRPTSDPVTGQRIISIKPSIDYMINEKLMLRIFYDRKQTDPYTSNSFPTIISSGGFSLRYTMQ